MSVSAVDAVIETHALTKRYGTARGIEDLTLTVERGEVFGFLGPNGAGKTTTIRTLLGLLRPTSGHSRLFGLYAARHQPEIHARLGNLPGEFAADPHLTGRRLLSFLAALRGLDGFGRAAELADRFDAELDRRLGELSRGNRQKIGLIQALFHDPELLVLDEPTGGLDPLMQEELLSVLVEERGRGRTIFLSSHDLDEVERACDRVGIVRDGRLVAVEPVPRVTERSYRHVTLEFAEPVDAREFLDMPGVRDVEADGARLTFKAEGGLDGVVKAAARHRLKDLEVSRPTLEEVFLTYYGGDGA